MSNEREPTCPSCGVAWREHDGVQGTCAELQRVRQLLASADLALTLAVKWAAFTRGYWDDGNDSKVGKCLLALSGDLKGYAPDTDAIHAYHKQIQEYRKEQGQ